MFGQAFIATALLAGLSTAAPYPASPVVRDQHSPGSAPFVLCYIISANMRIELAPTTVLAPAVHPDVNTGNVNNLKAAKSAQLFYAENASTAANSSVATLSIPSTAYPIVQLENTRHISSLTCSGSTASVVFADQAAYQVAASNWQSNFVMVSFDPSCGTGHAADERDFLLVNSVTLAPNTLTINAAISFVDFTTAIGDHSVVTAEFGQISPSGVAKRISESGSETFSWNEFPTNTLSTTQFGASGYQVASTSTFTLICAGCGTSGSLTVTGSISFSIFSGITAATISLSGNMQVVLELGLVANGLSASIPLGDVNILDVPLGGLDVPGIITIGPQIEVDVGATVDISATGSLLVGAVLSWPSIQATIDLERNTASGSGFSPSISPVHTISGSISATLDLHLPVSIGIGINILDGELDRQLALVDTPGVTVTGTVSTGSSCVEIDVDVYNKVEADIIGLTTISLFSFTDPVFSTCVAF